MKFRTFAAAAEAMLVLAAAAGANPVLMISIDGLRPLDIIEAKDRGLKVPNLTALMAQGAYATGVKNVLPTVTYPDHTTLVTGVWPDKHGIVNNTTFDPYGKNFGGWYWYSADIKVPTLWQAVHDAGGKTASIGWPVTVGNQAIDDNIPEYWRAGTADDLKLLDVLTTPRGFNTELAQWTELPMAAAFGEEPKHDVAKTKMAEAVIAHERPQFFTLHLDSVDGHQHAFGPGSKEAHEAIETVDGSVGELIAVARKAEPDVVVAVVSDHGFAAVDKQVNLVRAFADAGLIATDAKGKIVSWDAMPWSAGGSSEIVLARPDDAVLKAKTEDVLNKLAADPANGIEKILKSGDIAKLGGNPHAAFFVDFKPGFYSGSDIVAPLVTAGNNKGTHGYSPTHPEMRAAFFIAGPGIAHKSLGEIDMRDIAPTLAKILEVTLPTADGKPLPVAK